MRRSKNRTFRILPELDRALRQAAQRTGRSVSEEIEKRLMGSFQGDAITAAVRRAFEDYLGSKSEILVYEDDPCPAVSEANREGRTDAQ